MLAIARAQRFGRRFIILDEPTAALGVRESGAVLDYISHLSSQGISTILVSHNLDHVVKIADNACILRQGQRVGEIAATAANHERMVSMIVGSSAGSLSKTT